MAAETGLPENVVEALKRGDKVEAIKLLRQQTGAGLKEAKDAVDASGIEATPKSPGEVSAGSKWGWIVLVAIVAFAAYFLVRR